MCSLCQVQLSQLSSYTLCFCVNFSWHFWSVLSMSLLWDIEYPLFGYVSAFLEIHFCDKWHYISYREKLFVLKSFMSIGCKEVMPIFYNKKFARICSHKIKRHFCILRKHLCMSILPKIYVLLYSLFIQAFMCLSINNHVLRSITFST